MTCEEEKNHMSIDTHKNERTQVLLGNLSSINYSSSTRKTLLITVKELLTLTYIFKFSFVFVISFVTGKATPKNLPCKYYGYPTFQGSLLAQIVVLHHIARRLTYYDANENL